MSFYSALTYKMAIGFSRTYASIDMINFRRRLNGLLNEDVSEEDQDVVEETRSFYQPQFFSHILQELNSLAPSNFV